MKISVELGIQKIGVLGGVCISSDTDVVAPEHGNGSDLDGLEQVLSRLGAQVAHEAAVLVGEGVAPDLREGRRGPAVCGGNESRGKKHKKKAEIFSLTNHNFPPPKKTKHKNLGKHGNRCCQKTV